MSQEIRRAIVRLLKGAGEKEQAVSKAVGSCGLSAAGVSGTSCLEAGVVEWFDVVASAGIDRVARVEMARGMRKFARGGLTVREFEDLAELLSDRDEAVAQAYSFAWCFYCDFKTERLTGKWRLGREARRLWAKWVLFLLTSEAEYCGASMYPSVVGLGVLFFAWLGAGLLATSHPVVAGIALVVLGVCVWLGIPERIVYRAWRPKEPLQDYWPFASEEAFSEARRLSNPFAGVDGASERSWVIVVPD